MARFELLSALCVLVCVCAYPEFRAHLPNGYSFEKHPAIGHVEPLGGGQLNSFGKAFKVHRLDWKKFCREDTDKDGQYNGLELGDPCCLYNHDNNKTPLGFRTDQISNPTLQGDVTTATAPDCDALIAADEKAKAKELAYEEEIKARDEARRVYQEKLAKAEAMKNKAEL
eukprot:JP447452.1.p1 GENE.JP447452.1~~JP447452.1.p1  ORF type:complete len:170 (+),score=52.59 JP447452.1:20-529(+)